jgi:hypothetical protein
MVEFAELEFRLRVKAENFTCSRVITRILPHDSNHAINKDF